MKTGGVLPGLKYLRVSVISRYFALTCSADLYNTQPILASADKNQVRVGNLKSETTMEATYTAIFRQIVFQIE